MGPGKTAEASGGQNGLQRCGLRKQLLQRLGRDAALGQDKGPLLSWGAAWARRREKEARAAHLYTIETKQMVTPFFRFLSHWGKPNCEICSALCERMSVF